MAQTAADLREVEGLLQRAQAAPVEERLWLLTVAWQLLHEIAADLEGRLTAREPIAIGTGRARRSRPRSPRYAAGRAPSPPA